jgi:hypothetical protein
MLQRVEVRYEISPLIRGERRREPVLVAASARTKPAVERGRASGVHEGGSKADAEERWHLKP